MRLAPRVRYYIYIHKYIRRRLAPKERREEARGANLKTKTYIIGLATHGTRGEIDLERKTETRLRPRVGAASEEFFFLFLPEQKPLREEGEGEGKREGNHLPVHIRWYFGPYRGASLFSLFSLCHFFLLGSKTKTLDK